MVALVRFTYSRSNYLPESVTAGGERTNFPHNYDKGRLPSNPPYEFTAKSVVALNGSKKGLKICF